MPTRSRWQLGADAPPTTATPPPSTAVAVIGGGVIGVACAYALAARGVGVVLLEAGALAAGASGRNGGFVVASEAERRRLRAVLGAEAIDCAYAEPGHLALASSEHVLERFAGPDVEVLDRAACEDLLGLRVSPRFAGGRWQPTAALLDPVRLVLGLARAARRHGAVLVEGCPVRAVAARDGEIELETALGPVVAGDAIVACNVATAALVPAVAGRLRPARGQMLATTPGGEQAFRVGMALDFGSVYWRQDADGTLVIGGCRGADPDGEATDRDALNPLVQAALERCLADAFPGFPRLHPGSRWSGIMDETPDGAPLLGRAAPGVWVAAGFGGHGIPPALAAGEALARAIADGDPPAVLDRLSPARFDEVAA
jgi:gamma-glutamylputrescine oxidase